LFILYALYFHIWFLNTLIGKYIPSIFQNISLKSIFGFQFFYIIRTALYFINPIRMIRKLLFIWRFHFFITGFWIESISQGWEWFYISVKLRAFLLAAPMVCSIECIWFIHVLRLVNRFNLLFLNIVFYSILLLLYCFTIKIFIGTVFYILNTHCTLRIGYVMGKFILIKYLAFDLKFRIDILSWNVFRSFGLNHICFIFKV
jgi:hypothetical protein